MTSQTVQRLRRSLTVVLAAAAVLVLASQIYSGIRTRVEAGTKLQQTTERSAILAVDITHPLSGAPTQEVVLPGSTQAFVDSPIYARTFAAFIAGVGKMPYLKFLPYSVCGGAAWIFCLTVIGYKLGGVPIIRHNFEKVILGIIVLSLLPSVIEVVKAARASAR